MLKDQLALFGSDNVKELMVNTQVSEKAYSPIGDGLQSAIYRHEPI